MKTSTIEWNPVTPRPDKPGRYLIWSRDKGVRHTTLHPDWWNGQDPYKIGKVELYALLGEHFDQREMRKLHKKLTAKKKATKRRGAR